MDESVENGKSIVLDGFNDENDIKHNGDDIDNEKELNEWNGRFKKVVNIDFNSIPEHSNTDYVTTALHTHVAISQSGSEYGASIDAKSNQRSDEEIVLSNAVDNSNSAQKCLSKYASIETDKNKVPQINESIEILGPLGEPLDLKYSGWNDHRLFETDDDNDEDEFRNSVKASMKLPCVKGIGDFVRIDGKHDREAHCSYEECTAEFNWDFLTKSVPKSSMLIKVMNNDIEAAKYLSDEKLHGRKIQSEQLIYHPLMDDDLQDSNKCNLLRDKEENYKDEELANYFFNLKQCDVKDKLEAKLQELRNNYCRIYTFFSDYFGRFMTNIPFDTANKVLVSNEMLNLEKLSKGLENVLTVFENISSDKQIHNLWNVFSSNFVDSKSEDQLSFDGKTQSHAYSQTTLNSSKTPKCIEIGIDNVCVNTNAENSLMKVSEKSCEVAGLPDTKTVSSVCIEADDETVIFEDDDETVIFEDDDETVIFEDFTECETAVALIETEGNESLEEDLIETSTKVKLVNNKEKIIPVGDGPKKHTVMSSSASANCKGKDSKLQLPKKRSFNTIQTSRICKTAPLASTRTNVPDSRSNIGLAKSVISTTSPHIKKSESAKTNSSPKVAVRETKASALRAIKCSKKTV